MKILHTGDWHVGKTLRGHSRAGEHSAVLQEIASIARDEDVDLVLVAGDLFDSPAPAPESERIVYNALLGLAGAGAQVVVIAGNHDHPGRLAAIAPLLGLGNILVRPTPARPEEGGVLEVESRSGELARIALLPWLSQRHVVRTAQLMSKDGGDLRGDYDQRVRSVIAALAGSFAANAVNVFLAHLTLAGGQLGGGERAAQTIFDYYVEATAFPAQTHYTALGHLHRPQKMAGACPIHYCGSPLQLDFSDRDDHKSVLLVEASAGGPARVSEQPLVSGRRLRTIEGSLEQLSALRGQTGDDYLRIVVHEPARPGLGDAVRDLFPGAVDVIVAVPREVSTTGTDRLRRASGSPRELFAEYLAARNASDDRVLDLFDRLHDELYDDVAGEVAAAAHLARGSSP